MTFKNNDKSNSKFLAYLSTALLGIFPIMAIVYHIALDLPLILFILSAIPVTTCWFAWQISMEYQLKRIDINVKDRVLRLTSKNHHKDEGKIRLITDLTVYYTKDTLFIDIEGDEATNGVLLHNYYKIKRSEWKEFDQIGQKLLILGAKAGEEMTD